jgi:hypothetical protein
VAVGVAVPLLQTLVLLVVAALVDIARLLLVNHLVAVHRLKAN